MTRIKSLVGSREVQRQEVFMLTDRLTFESTYYKGYSTFWKLLRIILRLYQAIRDGSLLFHVIQVDGTRMEIWGVDGLPRGYLLEGMAERKDPLLFVPLAEKVGKLVSSWWRDSEGKKPWGNMDPTDVTKDNLFDLYKVKGPRLWMPQPVAMETIIEVCNEDRMAHPHQVHVFVIHRPVTHLQRKRPFQKGWICPDDYLLRDHSWDKSQHQPLILTIILPFVYVENYREPWIARGLEKPEVFGRNSRPVSRSLLGGT